MLGYIDGTYINDWLVRTNAQLQDLQEWWTEAAHAVDFTHFWLSEVPREKCTQLLEMEMDLLRKEVELSFRVGMESGSVSSSTCAATVLRSASGDAGAIAPIAATTECCCSAHTAIIMLTKEEGSTDKLEKSSVESTALTAAAKVAPEYAGGRVSAMPEPLGWASADCGCGWG